MRSNAVGACGDRSQRRTHGIGPVAAARIAQRRDVIDIYSKAYRGEIGHRRLLFSSRYQR
jgi:hypothetical protein